MSAKIILNGKEVTRDELINSDDGRIISHYEVIYNEETGFPTEIQIETAPPTAHLPHVQRAEA